MEVLKNIAVILGLIISAGTIICVTIPNIRHSIIKWAARQEKQDSLDETLSEIKAMLKDRQAVEGDLKCEIEKIKDSQRSILRDRITAIYYKHLEDRTLRTYEKENLTHLKDSYDAIEGNSFVGGICAEMFEWKVVF